MPLPLSADHLAKQEGEYEPQRANNGFLTIDNILNWGETGAGDFLTLAVEAFPLPKESNGVIEMRWMNERRKVAGPITIENMDITIRNYVDRGVALALLQWRRSCYSPRDLNVGDVTQIRAAGGAAMPPLPAGGIQMSRFAKRNGRCVLVGPDGNAGRERYFSLQGILPLSLDPGDVDFTSEDYVKMTVTLSIDRVLETDSAAVNYRDGATALSAGTPL